MSRYAAEPTAVNTQRNVHTISVRSRRIYALRGEFRCGSITALTANAKNKSVIHRIFECSKCGYSFEHEGYQHFFNYCPNCGAKMDEQ